MNDNHAPDERTTITSIQKWNETKTHKHFIHLPANSIVCFVSEPNIENHVSIVEAQNMNVGSFEKLHYIYVLYAFCVIANVLDFGHKSNAILNVKCNEWIEITDSYSGQHDCYYATK